ncbi:MAG: LLM class flavin-dependent oxidoreductase [Gammaproteobacteria bacterium]|nr:LLM class flavin-dependent oxidoreductase [Gammaproteobacteria bacterium]
MVPRKRIGLMLWPAPGLDADFARGRWAEQVGFDDVWLPDAEGMQDPIALAATLAVSTRRVRICTGVVPVFNRPAPILATSVSVIAHHAPGRFVLGLGSSTGNMVERWYGVPFQRPLTHVREYVQLLRQIFAGEKTAFAGACLRSHGFRLQTLPQPAVPLHVGAMGPRMLQLAGELADGVVLNDFTPPDRLAFAMEQLDVGARRGGRRVEDLEIVKRRAYIVTSNAAENAAAREFFRRYFAFYASAPAYQEVMLQLGYAAAVAEIRAGYAGRDRARVTAAISDDMVSRIFLFGSAEQCHAQARADYAAGIGALAMSPQAATAEAFARSAGVFAAAAFNPAAPAGG